MLGTEQDIPDDGLDQTVDVLDSGVTTLTPSAALTIIERWREACLRDEGGLDLEAVASGLDDLHGLLSADRLDGRAIGRTLAGLADATAAVAAGTDEERVTPGLERLAGALSRAADFLGG
ncbi:MAG TPA: hypothetical protein VF576_09735 [Rubricoccaceae bacterium]